MAADPQPTTTFHLQVITSTDLLCPVTWTQHTHLNTSDSRAQGISHPGHQIPSLLLWQTFRSWQGEEGTSQRAPTLCHWTAGFAPELSPCHTPVYLFSYAKQKLAVLSTDPPPRLCHTQGDRLLPCQCLPLPGHQMDACC